MANAHIYVTTDFLSPACPSCPAPFRLVAEEDYIPFAVSILLRAMHLGLQHYRLYLFVSEGDKRGTFQVVVSNIAFFSLGGHLLCDYGEFFYYCCLIF